VSHGTVRRTPETVDLAFEAGRNVENGLPQRLAFNEIVRRFIQRPLEKTIEPGGGLIDANKNLVVKKVVPGESEAGAVTGEDAIAALGGKEVVGPLHGLVKNVVEDLQLRIVDKKEANGRLVEDRTDKFLVTPQRTCRRLDLRQIVERENDVLSAIGNPIDQPLDLFDPDAPRGVQDDMRQQRVRAALGQIHVIA